MFVTDPQLTAALDTIIDQQRTIIQLLTQQNAAQTPFESPSTRVTALYTEE